MYILEGKAKSNSNCVRFDPSPIVIGPDLDWKAVNFTNTSKSYDLKSTQDKKQKIMEFINTNPYLNN